MIIMRDISLLENAKSINTEKEAQLALNTFHAYSKFLKDSFLSTGKRNELYHAINSWFTDFLQNQSQGFKNKNKDIISETKVFLSMLI